MNYYYIFRYESKNKEEHTKECTTFKTLLKVYKKMKNKLRQSKLETVVVEKWLDVGQDFVCLDSKLMHKNRKANNDFSITVYY